MKNQTTPTKNFLFTTWEGGGNIAPVITVARKLLKRGHQVRLMSDAANREDAEDAGIRFVPWQNAPSRPNLLPATCPLRDWEATSPQEGIMRLMERIMFGPALEYARDLAAELDREPADLVVTSEMLAGVLAACEARHQRVVILATNLCVYPLAGMPTFGPGLPPPRTPEEEALHEQIRQGTLGMLNSCMGGLDRARVALGLLPLQSAIDQLRVAKLYLLASSRVFDFPVQNLPPQIRYVGPQLDEPAWVKPWTSPWPASDNRPLVLAAFSTTYQAHENVLQKVIDATASLPVRTLITLGQVEASKLRPSENTRLVSSAPHNTVMQKAAVVITHGGHGTIMRALRHQRPLLVIPHGRDQDENAIRITERGAGLKLGAGAGYNEIKEAIHRLLTEPSFAEAAKRLGTSIADEAKNDPVVPLLEESAGRTENCACLSV